MLGDAESCRLFECFLGSVAGRHKPTVLVLRGALGTSIRAALRAHCGAVELDARPQGDHIGILAAATFRRTNNQAPLLVCLEQGDAAPGELAPEHVQGLLPWFDGHRLCVGYCGAEPIAMEADDWTRWLAHCGALWGVLAELQVDRKCKLLRRSCIDCLRGDLHLLHRLCARCAAPRARQLCSACGVERYCSAACQRAHWPQHREDCSSAGAAPLFDLDIQPPEEIYVQHLLDECDELDELDSADLAELLDCEADDARDELAARASASARAASEARSAEQRASICAALRSAASVDERLWLLVALCRQLDEWPLPLITLLDSLLARSQPRCCSAAQPLHLLLDRHYETLWIRVDTDDDEELWLPVSIQ